MAATSPTNDENIITSLSRWRERARVRVDIIMAFPLTFVLSPRGEEIKRFYFLSNVIFLRAFFFVLVFFFVPGKIPGIVPIIAMIKEPIKK
jgi:hypothetical protein